MARQQFDKLDYRILTTISDNARKPFLEIARESNVSGAAIHQRVQKLIGNGVIRGFETILNPNSAGFETCAYIGFILKDSSRFNEVIEVLKEIPQVVECHITSGQYDILAKIYAKNNNHLMKLIHEKMNTIGLARTESLISFQEVFKRPIPIGTDND